MEPLAELGGPAEGRKLTWSQSQDYKFSPILSVVLILGIHRQSYFKLVYSCLLALESCPAVTMSTASSCSQQRNLGPGKLVSSGFQPGFTEDKNQDDTLLLGTNFFKIYFIDHTSLSDL